jgi:hypothetical protein
MIVNVWICQLSVRRYGSELVLHRDVIEPHFTFIVKTRRDTSFEILPLLKGLEAKVST